MWRVAGQAQADAPLGELNERFEHEPARSIVGWAVQTFSPDICVTTSLTDAVLVDLAVRADPSIEIVFIDTGYHFAQTIGMVEIVRQRYDANIRVMRAPTPAEPAWQTDPLNCCSSMKVEQLDIALRGKRSWMTGVRRCESVERRRTPIVGMDRRGLVKLNPLAAWSDRDLAAYIRDHGVPVNPLVERGYASIGCWPCTRPIAEGEDHRAGRWPGLAKTECGLHD